MNAPQGYELSVFLEEVRRERRHQTDKGWDRGHDLRHTPPEWAALLARYLGRFADAVCDLWTFAPDLVETDGVEGLARTHEAVHIMLLSMEKNLVQLAAVAAAAAQCIEAHDRNLKLEARRLMRDRQEGAGAI